uniref:Protein kinase domain-containing protein n=1 Tax=Macrostomum lignano TaxID=282301 RepID=A0A1I8FJ82_9PLAT
PNAIQQSLDALDQLLSQAGQQLNSLSSNDQAAAQQQRHSQRSSVGAQSLTSSGGGGASFGDDRCGASPGPSLGSLGSEEVRKSLEELDAFLREYDEEEDDCEGDRQAVDLNADSACCNRGSSAMQMAAYCAAGPSPDARLSAPGCELMFDTPAVPNSAEAPESAALSTTPTNASLPPMPQQSAVPPSCSSFGRRCDAEPQHFKSAATAAADCTNFKSAARNRFHRLQKAPPSLQPVPQAAKAPPPPQPVPPTSKRRHRPSRSHRLQRCRHRHSRSHKFQGAGATGATDFKGAAPAPAGPTNFKGAGATGATDFKGAAPAGPTNFKGAGATGATDFKDAATAQPVPQTSKAPPPTMDAGHLPGSPAAAAAISTFGTPSRLQMQQQQHPPELRHRPQRCHQRKLGLFSRCRGQLTPPRKPLVAVKKVAPLQLQLRVRPQPLQQQPKQQVRRPHRPAAAGRQRLRKSSQKQQQQESTANEFRLPEPAAGHLRLRWPPAAAVAADTSPPATRRPLRRRPPPKEVVEQAAALDDDCRPVAGAGYSAIPTARRHLRRAVLERRNREALEAHADRIRGCHDLPRPPISCPACRTGKRQPAAGAAAGRQRRGAAAGGPSGSDGRRSEAAAHCAWRHARLEAPASPALAEEEKAWPD